LVFYSYDILQKELQQATFKQTCLLFKVPDDPAMVDPERWWGGNYCQPGSGFRCRVSGVSNWTRPFGWWESIMHCTFCYRWWLSTSIQSGFWTSGFASCWNLKPGTWNL